MSAVIFESGRDVAKRKLLLNFIGCKYVHRWLLLLARLLKCLAFPWLHPWRCTVKFCCYSLLLLLLLFIYLFLASIMLKGRYKEVVTVV